MNRPSLHPIPVSVEPTTGNVAPLLNEIRHALKDLLETGQRRVIDLRGIPLAPGDEERLERFLGTGELEARVHALGLSRVWETRFAGVWMVVHENAAGEIAGKSIEVVRVPAILESQRDDMALALEALERALAEPVAEPADPPPA